MMPEPTQPYHPIACGFHDRLEDWAVRRTPIEIVWRDGDETHRTTAVLADVYAKEGADWLRLDTGEIIRLNRLITVNGIALPDVC
jgi:Rho-binding antiterminator